MTGMNDFAWSIEGRKDPEIVLACDASLDEGNAIIRATFEAGLGSAGTEYFVQMDREEASALVSIADVCEDGGGDPAVAEAVARLRWRAVRVLNYCDNGSEYVIRDVQAAEPDQLTFGRGVCVTVHGETDSMGLNRVDLRGTKTALRLYLLKHWGDTDAEWLRDTLNNAEEIGRA